MRHDVNQVWDAWQEELFANQEALEAEALRLHRAGELQALKELLTQYTMEWGNKAVRKAWQMGDMLWTRYDELF
jgi:hypothetical protein